MEKNLKISNLMDFYAELLTKNQKQVLNLYYNEDFSLSEIAENQGITRQGVRDKLKKAEAQLLDLENKLKLVKKYNRIEKKLLVIIENSEKLMSLSNDEIYKVSLLANNIKNTAISIYKEQ